MKFLKNLLVIIAVLCFVSCSKDDNINKSDTNNNQELADYTVIMYGNGVSGIFDDVIEYLEEVDASDYTPKLNFTAKIKFDYTTQIKNPELYEGTRLLTLKKEGLVNERVGDKDFRMDNPDNIANFIKEAKEKNPAKHYILVLTGADSSLGISDNPDNITDPNSYSRSFGYDTYNGAAISIFELEEGLKRANTKFDMIYGSFGSCGSFEYLYQIKDYTKYILASAANGTIMTTFHSEFLSALEHNSNLVDAMKSYIHDVYYLSKYFSENSVKDLSLIDTESLEELAQQFKKYSDLLCDYRNNLKEGSQEELYYNYVNSTSLSEFKDDCYSKGGILFFYPSSSPTTIDFSSFVELMSYRLSDYKLKTIAMNIKEKMKDVIIASESDTKVSYIENISLGLMWQKKESFNLEKDGVSIKDVYKKTKFDQVTNWSRFLEKNSWKKVERIYLYSLGNLYYEAGTKFNKWHLDIDYTKHGGLSEEEFDRFFTKNLDFFYNNYIETINNTDLPEGDEEVVLSSINNTFYDQINLIVKILNIHLSDDLIITFTLHSDTLPTITKELVYKAN